jgi:hypothetical protein
VDANLSCQAPGENPNIDNVVIPQIQPPLVRTSNLQHVTFQGLTLAYDNYLVDPAGHPGRQMEIDIAPMLSIQNSQYITFDSGTFEHISGTGLEISPAFPRIRKNRHRSTRRPPGVCSQLTRMR